MLALASAASCSPALSVLRMAFRAGVIGTLPARSAPTDQAPKATPSVAMRPPMNTR